MLFLYYFVIIQLQKNHVYHGVTAGALIAGSLKSEKEKVTKVWRVI